jgi:hypothetical protein
MAIYTSAAACAAAQAQARAGVIWHSFASASAKKLAAANPASAPSGSPWKRLPLPAAFAGTLMLVCFRRRSRLLRAVLSLGAVVLISVAGLGLTACSSSSSGSSPTTPTSTDSPLGTYTLTLIGADSKTSTITNSTTLTLTVN